MFNVNNLAGTTVARSYAYSRAKTGTDYKADRKASSTEGIQFSQPAEKTEAKREVQLSEKAQNYLADLKQRYKDYSFVVADFKAGEDTSELFAGMEGEMGVLITPDLLERMAEDESVREKYEAIIAGASDKFSQIKENLGADAGLVDKLGITVNDDGSIDFTALLKKSLQPPMIMADTADSLVEQVKKIAEKRVQEAEEKKAEAERESTMPPKSFEKYRKEKEPYDTKEDYGNLPPESFQKYRKEKDPYDTKEDYGNLPPESFQKYRKEKELYDTEEDYGNLPPESFQKYTEAKESISEESIAEKNAQKFLTDDAVSEEIDFLV